MNTDELDPCKAVYFHAWYSKEYDSQYGHQTYRSMGGKTVKVSAVCRSEDITKHLVDWFPWVDAQYVGIVTERINSNPPGGGTPVTV